MKVAFHGFMLVLFLPVMVAFHTVGIVAGIIASSAIAGFIRGFNYNPADHIKR